METDRFLKFGTQDKEYILCAAIRRITPRQAHICYHEQYRDIYKIEIGWRHPDIGYRFAGEVSKNPYDQGFYTSKGRFVTRDEAREIARACGQIPSDFNRILTSEDLY